MIGWLSTLIRRWRDRPDKAWAPTGVRVIYEGYCEKTQDAARHRKAQHDKATRQLADQRTQPKAGKRYDFPRKASNQ